jgi:high-affinity nickel-transport protein
VFTLLPIAALGFFLGIRHATDPDHVIAVSTIVSRERRVGTAALIGALWGVGHTFTILVAGGAIVLFEVVIPPRVGLTMELSVALMLILLGGTTVIGVLRPRGHPHVHGDYVHAHPYGHDRVDHDHGEQETPVARLDRRDGPAATATPEFQAMRGWYQFAPHVRSRTQTIVPVGGDVT